MKIDRWVSDEEHAEDVARAVRYMDAWLPIGAGSIGLGTVDAIQTLMEHARQPERAPD